jgi:DNA-binding NarL/FixJ family response regulator
MTQIPVDVSRSLADDLPRGRLVVLEGSQPSLFMPEDVDMVVDMLLRFFCDGIEPSPELQASGPGVPSGRLPAGQHGLSSRELEVLRLLAEGESNRQIASRLGLSPHTIERHVANLYRKIGARGRADATAYALRSGLA